MQFNTAVFLFLFLPFFLILYFVADPKWRLWVGLVASLLFYAWGQAITIPLIAAIVAVNFILGSQIEKQRAKDKTLSKRLLTLGILVNIGVLAAFKVLISYGVEPFAAFLPERVELWLQDLTFPLGLSYISFQVTSYLIDVSNGTLKAERNWLPFTLYVFLFPKLLVGPITRYSTLGSQLVAPAPSRAQIADGMRRFMRGLAKKVLIADVLATLVNAVFNQPAPTVAPEIAWLALAAYALQIFFDFSGLVDMAIGLGMMMGLRFIENFNFPYIAQSIADFWRRWHISLSTWFRDYVYFPLERRRVRFIGQPLNILIVFLLTGLWHGVTVMFIAWGLLHGVLLVLESLFLGKWLQKLPRIVRHVYVIAALLLTWLFFRSPSPEFALAYLGRLAGSSQGIAAMVFTESAPLPFIEPSFLLAFAAGLLFCLPLGPFISARLQRSFGSSAAAALPLTLLGDLLLLALFILSISAMVSSRFMPGIYGSF